MFYDLFSKIIRFLMDIRTHKLPTLDTRLPTGGELNRLNEAKRCNVRHRTVPVMDLVRYHRPSSPEALRKCIEEHHHQASTCTLCNCRSVGTVEQFASTLYMAQFNAPAHTPKRRYTWDECYRFHYTLFCIAPLRGLAMERAAQEQIEVVLRQEHILLESTTHHWCVREATRHEDFDCAVDLVIERVRVNNDDEPTENCTDEAVSSTIALGIQVKPESVLHRKAVMKQNRTKQETFGAPVVFMVYDRKGTFRPTAKEIVKGVRW